MFVNVKAQSTGFVRNEFTIGGQHSLFLSPFLAMGMVYLQFKFSGLNVN